MYLARSRPTVLTWFMDASWSGVQHLHSGTPRPLGGVHMGSSRERVAPSFRHCRSRRGADCCSSDHDGAARLSRDRAGLGARNRLVQITTELSNQIRGLMKPFGLVPPAGKGSRFEANVRALLADQEGLAPILLPLLEAWRAVRLRAAELGRQRVTSARRSEACQILMSVPGVGAVTATSFATAVEDPETFRR